ncbi:MAG TPA: glucosaminidase domain-containing protein, partial [Acidimicrobiales bacterium]|nr:glucosaminidase domain-containing protein [Acidimicrobiales bacterium]
RSDVAFAQSVIETGYFAFPVGGQVAGADNNFAGIGACDSCSHGWTFPDARTGVSAQIQLLDAYASTTPVATPLIGKVSVAGCCRTWAALTGVWATNPNYGYEVLSIYRQMVEWALPRRLATGL